MGREQSSAVGPEGAAPAPGPRGRPGAALAAGGMGLAVDLGASYLIWLAPGGQLVLALGIVAHVVSASLVGVVLSTLWRPGGVGLGAGAGILAAISIPPLGAGLIAGLLVWYAIQRPAPQYTSPVPEEAEPAQRKRLPATGRVSVDDLIKADTDVQPLVDVLHSSDLALKASAIDVMARLRGRQLIRTMRELLHAPEADIRFQASVGLSRLEGNLSNAIVDAKAAADAYPDSAEGARVLAALCLDYALSGLLDDESAAHYASLALAEFRRGESLEPEVESTLQQARCHMLLGQHRECVALLEQRAIDPREREAAVVLKLEALYGVGEYDKLRKEAAGVTDVAFEDPSNQAIVQWWAAA